ncbi:MAG: FGGY-family carbohydrate kinase [Clostridiales bacterium]|nr:FGGY-family carbohydrate kinase [Clostridiales bacterium]
MVKSIYAIAYDIGTTGVKTCLFEISDKIELLAAESQGYNLYVIDGGGAEQHPDEWWEAMCSTTKSIMKKVKVKAEDISGISFCSQMQGVVLVDKDGNAVRPAFSYMDQRAREEMKECMGKPPRIAGGNAQKVLKSLMITGAAPLSVKDPVWKYKWVEKHEPQNFKKVYKWLDVKEYLIVRMTGEFIMTHDSAFSTMIYDIKKNTWSPEMCKMIGINMDHLATIVKSTDRVGTLTKKAADELGLAEGTAVFGGGGDASLIGVGAGSTRPGDTHIYQGTSGWVSTVVEKSIVDTSSMIAAIVGARPGYYNYFAEMETAGKCAEWVKDHLALDEIDIYMNKQHNLKHGKADMEVVYTNLYDYMMAVVDTIEPGSGGVIFTPWLHGNRCPFEDPNAKGMFFNISLETGKSELIRAVMEGVCFHLRWMLETQDKKIKTSTTIRFVGGGALSDITCQMLADCTGRIIETVASPQNVGAVGAACVISAGVGIIKDLADAKTLIPAAKTFQPDFTKKVLYDKNFEVFKELYNSNKKNFEMLNGGK